MMVIFEPPHNFFGTNCLPCQRGLPSNRAKNYGLYDHIFYLVLQASQIVVHVHHYACVTWPILL